MPERPSARDAALWALGRFRANPARLEPYVKESFARFDLDGRDRALAMELAYGTVRNLIRIDYTLSRFIREKPGGIPDEMRDIMRIAAYQLMYLTRVPAHAAVDEAVGRAKRLKGPGMAGFVNAVLRALIRGISGVTYPETAEDPINALSIRHSFPVWLTKRWVGRFGPDAAEALMQASNTPPPITLRANTLKVGRDELAGRLTESGISTIPAKYAPDGLIIEPGRQVSELPGYLEGLFAVQDEAAQLVSMLLGPKPGETILDACAAPGGKTAHIASLMGGSGKIIASDISLDKMRLLSENMKRLGIAIAYPLILGAASPLPFGRPFDRILLDAPCSALGVIRRRPEIKYSRIEDDIRRLSWLQGAMLRNLADLVRTGGVLVFSTCSTEPEEGESVIESFLKEDRRFRLDDPASCLTGPARGLVTGRGMLRTYPHEHGTDGFFAARLVRTC